ncbi:endogenous retrovirus group K member 7 Gag polyprotein-like [Peromyscus eremicus]|uniref:endogenous retrovirus group K member 7 Gag polyprotein-like n=1 Tax=Peromyscus eremicus TaxID=42410 RepID=UPI0027DB242A|nr:endogenous retrovirus group K member 7 Gag polyprotein-like [Peromyscus eremicus]
MGQENSKETFEESLVERLKNKGIKVELQQVQRFLKFVEELCPWFPEYGKLNENSWERVGVEIKKCYEKHGPENIPVEALGLWALIQDNLDPNPEKQEGSFPKADEVETQPSAPPAEPENPCTAPLKQGPVSLGHDAKFKEQKSWNKTREELKNLKSLVTSLTQKIETLQVSPLPSVGVELDSPGEASFRMEKPPVIAIAQKSSEAMRTLSVKATSPLQASLREAASKGEEIQGFQMFPVLEEQDRQGNIIRVHVPIPFKQLKELKTACSQYGPTAPFTTALLESLALEVLPPGDWKQMARACLSGGDYLLCKSEFVEQCQATAEINRAQQIPITFDMLAGEGPYRKTGQQLNFDIAVYAQVQAAAKRAWNTLPSSGRQTEDLSKIRQGPDELFQDFVSRLMQTASRLISDSEAGLLLVKQLAYENANAACQAAIRPFRKKGNISDYIRLCSDIGPSYNQGIVMAAALQGKMVRDVLYQQRHPNSRQGKDTGPPGSCFGCGQMGHYIRSCSSKRRGFGSNREPGLCPRCRRGKHRASECTSRANTQKSLFQGNGQRGPS